MDLYATNPGPVDNTVLYNQDKHVSAAVWEGQERGALRCHEHTSKLDQWILTPKQVELVKKAGFGFLRLIPSISLDNPLISALVERWRRETNTFHFPVGEMTVTLQDVAYLLGLAIDGEPVIGVTYTSCEAICLKLLGKVPDSGYTSGGMVKLSWLKETFSHYPNDASSEEIERHARAYLLYLVGSTIFSTTTGNKVPVMYLPLFEDFDTAGKYAWGAAALSFLYRALGNASLKSQSTISGCLTLLQCWSYYHLSVGRPKLRHDPVHNCFPYVLTWRGKQNGPTANRDVAFYRKALDTLDLSDVEWCPYRNINHNNIPEELRNSIFIGRSRTMLICFDKAERHLPDRCLRQYGFPQSIPEEVPLWERKSRGVDGGIDLSRKMESELNEWSERHLHIVEEEEDIFVDEAHYANWYSNITRKLVGRPISILSEYQRMDAALRDIGHLADTLSTDGMDEEQINSVARIRHIVHDCLRGHVGCSTVVIDHSNEHAKSGRGKETVRRKGTGKRKKKGDSDQSMVSIAINRGDVDHSQTCHLNDEVIHEQSCLEVGDANDQQICHPDTLADTSHFCHVVNEGDDLHILNTPKEANGIPQLSHMSIEVYPQPSLETGKEVSQQNDYSVLV